MADAQSSWASAQRRYASVLGNMEPNIQQADLGAKGTYYRVRVGPWASRGEAVQVCERLRAAGGDCIVTR
jgi:cell division protein FtsN